MSPWDIRRTDEIPVVTRGPVPQPVHRVRVTGVVNQALTLADQSLVVLIETDEASGPQPRTLNQAARCIRKWF
ncbi:MAG: hypothetical protein NZ742_01240 [Acidobacteria bacterium]|nr:hypothetical protein [Acidobacteriota bacterium]MDW7983484.1 hypothetical protein [Acidobacteriota bacterium]